MINDHGSLVILKYYYPCCTYTLMIFDHIIEQLCAGPIQPVPFWYYSFFTKSIDFDRSL